MPPPWIHLISNAGKNKWQDLRAIRRCLESRKPRIEAMRSPERALRTVKNTSIHVKEKREVAIHLSRSEILQTIQEVINIPGRIKAKSASSEMDNVVLSLMVNAHGHPWILLGFIEMALISVAL
ncbi:hypothetical protein RUND412_005093 [Rhizina undulata]